MSYEEEASFSCTTTSLLWYTSRHTWPSLLSPAAHPVTSDSVSPLQPHVPLPPIPPRLPRDQQGKLVLQPGDCCLLILQRLCIKWWGGGFVCESVCVRAPHKRVSARAFALSLSLALSLSRSLSLSCMHACTGGCGRTLRTPTLSNNTQRSMSMPGSDAGLRTLSSTQETPALGRVNGQCTTTGLVFFIE